MRICLCEKNVEPPVEKNDTAERKSARWSTLAKGAASISSMELAQRSPLTSKSESALLRWCRKVRSATGGGGSAERPSPKDCSLSHSDRGAAGANGIVAGGRVEVVGTSSLHASTSVAKALQKASRCSGGSLSIGR